MPPGEVTPEANYPAQGEPPLDPEKRGLRGGVAKIQNDPGQERPGEGSSKSRSIPERELSDRTGRPTYLKELGGRKRARAVDARNKDLPYI